MARAYSKADGMIAPVGLEWPRVSAWLIAFLSKASAAASRTRRSCQGDFGSHISGPKLSHWLPAITVGTSLSPAVRFTSSPSGPRSEYATSTSPRLSMASLVRSSETTFHTSRLTVGVLRQYRSCASRTSSTPGLNDVSLYGPAPMGAFLKPSSPTFSTYFLGTIQPAPLAGVP